MGLTAEIVISIIIMLSSAMMEGYALFSSEFTVTERILISTLVIMIYTWEINKLTRYIKKKAHISGENKEQNEK